MLVNEHIFSTLLSVLSGTGVGVVASALFIKLFTIIFLPQKHNIPIKFVYNMGDYTKLAIIILGMIIIPISRFVMDMYSLIILTIL